MSRSESFEERFARHVLVPRDTVGLAIHASGPKIPFSLTKSSLK